MNDRNSGDFYRYLMSYPEDRTPIGDLVRDIKRDRCFPVYNYSLDLLTQHLQAHKATQYALCALTEAHMKFREMKKNYALL